MFTQSCYSTNSRDTIEDNAMPDFDDLLQIGTILSIITVYFQVRQSSKAMAADVFTTYTMRYAEIMKQLPPELRGRLFNAKADETAKYKQDVDIVLAQYLDLCCEEFYLSEHRMLPKSIWTIWSAEMSQCLTSDAVRQFWQENRDSYQSNPSFQKLVNEGVARYSTSS
jgi:hypothetical protein